MQEIKNGRYEFVVHFPESELPQIFVHYNGKSYRKFTFRKSENAFECGYGKEATPSLLEALILSFLTFESVGAKNFKELTEKRIECWRNSVRYVTKREKFEECPFECY